MNNAQIIAAKLKEFALKNENSYFVCVDAAEAIWMGDLRQHISENRIIHCGISEQTAVGIAAGLALHGKKVYLIAPAYFITGRAYEQVKLDLAYNNANVTLLAVSAGIVGDSLGGISHWAIDCLSLLKDLPHITLANVATTGELSYYLDESFNHKGFMCIMDELPYSELDLPLKIQSGKMSQICKGRDLIFLTTGNALHRALVFKKELNKKGYWPAIYNIHSIKPFDKNELHQLIDKGLPIVSFDEHTAGGLTSLISQIIAEYGKRVKYLPVYVCSENFNIVGYYEHICLKLLKYEEVLQNIMKMMPFFRSLFVKKEKKNPDGYVRKHTLFGFIPLLKIKNKIKNGKTKKSIYLFGFLRIR